MSSPENRPMARLLIISPEPTGEHMAGPAIRALELGCALVDRCEVRLAAPDGAELPGRRELTLEHYDPLRPRSLRAALRACDVVLAPPPAPALAAEIHRAARPWIADLCNPEPFEGLEFGRGLSASRRRAHETLRADRLAVAARTATSFVCANDRQRDMWLGFLAAHRRLRGDRYEHDRPLGQLLAVVPNGIPPAPPEPAATPVVRGVHVRDDALIAIWNGGLWDWLDPLTVIEAIATLRDSDPRWALVFLGSERPGGTRHMSMHTRAIELARARGLEADGGAYFEPGWTPYDERGALLLEADVGVCAHPDTAEARFSSRSRMLDLVWAGLPAVSTAVDDWSERIVAERLGEVVAPGDAAAFAGALATAAAGDYRAALAAAAAARTWSAVAAPLPALIDAAAAAGPARVGLTARSLALRHRLAAAGDRAARRRERSERPGH
jgi:hypothetical protein